MRDGGNSYMERYLRSNGLEAKVLLEAKPHVFLGRQHPLAGRTSLCLDDLAAYPYVTYDQGENGPIDFAEELTESHTTSKQVHISDRATLMNLLLSTDAYTVGTGIMTSSLNQGTVVPVPLESGDVYTIAAIYRADIGLGEDAAKFLRTLAEVTGRPWFGVGNFRRDSEG